jgi:hypothetical protein
VAVKVAECFVGLIDILGFSDLVKNGQLKRVYKTYLRTKHSFSAFQRAINRKHDSKVVNAQIFSDTFLVYTDTVGDDRFRAMLAMVGILFVSAMENDLMVRGAVTTGTLIASGRAIIGKPIVDAYAHEQAQEWMGCWFASDSMEGAIPKEYLDDSISKSTILKYKIPLKSGDVKEHCALNWVRFMKVLYEGLNGGASITETELRRSTSLLNIEGLKWDAQRKIINTRAFLKYAIKMLMKEGSDDSRLP